MNGHNKQSKKTNNKPERVIRVQNPPQNLSMTKKCHQRKHYQVGRRDLH